MQGKPFIIKILLLTTLIVYLFFSAEPPLPEESGASKIIPIDLALRAVAAENDQVRSLYTKEIVGAGIKAGLAFDEDWKLDDVEAGPLPALFLRETAASLEKSPVRLGLFLGSDYPITPANKFDTAQLEKFRIIKQTREPQFFFAEDTKLHTAMFADLAVAKACVTCHNDHAQTPKSDWQLNDVMGATTWSYPSEAVTMEEFIAMVSALREGFRETYSMYLEKVAGFSNPPQIGDRWPSEGYYLPSVDRFMEEVTRRTSAQTLSSILGPVETIHEAE